MGRYSDEAMEKVHRQNFERWMEKAVKRHGGRFYYSLSWSDFHTQKKPPVRIMCPKHGQFRVSPHDHLRFKGGGCAPCGLRERGEAKRKHHAERFQEFFEERLANRLKLVSPYTGVQESISVRCLVHGVETTTTPDQLLHGAVACSDCVAESVREALRLKLEDVLSEFEGQFPNHVKITDIRFVDNHSEIKIECERHGTKWVTKGHLTRSDYGCPDCGNEMIGHAGYRLKQLVETGKTGRPTWLGVMEIEVFGISALKVGVTTRGFEARYGQHLKEIHFSAKLSEIDALIIENEVHRRFKEQADLRIMKAGMRHGKRWSGDNECYWFREREDILDFIRKRIADVSQEKPDYFAALSAFEQPDFNIRRPNSRSRGPTPVVCVDTGEIFPSQLAAAKDKGVRQGNISQVLFGKRKTAGGLRWRLAEED